MQVHDSQRIVVVGAGGFGREVLDVIEDITAARTAKYSIAGVIDPHPVPRNVERLRDRGIRYLGSEVDWLSRPDAEYFAVGIGDPTIRRSVAAAYLNAGLTPAALVHPSVTVGRRTRLDRGVIICSGAVISTNVWLGEFATVNPNATIGHDARVGAYVSVNPGAIVSGEVTVGEQTLIGAGAVILENRSVGALCTVGASACVTHDIPEGSVVKGVPAR